VSPSGSSATAVLVDEVAERVPQPVDPLEIAAVLESLGVTDDVAASDYSVPTVFELAAEVFAELRLQTRAPSTSASSAGEDPGEAPPSPAETVWRGLFSLAPLLVLAAGLWGLGEAGASRRAVFAVGLGATASILLTNGPIQAISRRASFYLGLGDRRAAWRYLLSGLATVLALAAPAASLGLLVAAGVGGTEPRERALFAIAFVSAAPLWLLAAGLSLVRATGWSAVSFGLGLLAAGGLVRLPMLGGTQRLELAVGLGYLVGVVALLCFGRWAFARGSQEGPAAPLPPARLLLTEALPYVVFGSGLMAFLVEAHVLGWVGAAAPGESRASTFIAFETGLTLALPPVVLSIGLAERSLWQFWSFARELSERTPADDGAGFCTALVRFQRSHLLGYLLRTALLSVAALLGGELALRSGDLTRLLRLADPGSTELVFVVGIIAFVLYGGGQLSCLLLLNLSRPREASRAVACGAAVLAAVGGPLGVVGFRYAVFGFLAGATAFALAAAVECTRVLRSADYHYAVAF